MSEKEENTVDEITFEDVPALESRQKSPIEFLPLELREQAERLPSGKEYTVLELVEEGNGHNDSLLTVAATCFRMGVSYEDTLAHLQDQYHQDRIDYETAPQRAVDRIWSVEGDVSKLVDQDAADKVSAQEEMLLRFRRTSQNQLLETSPEPVATKARDIVEGLFAPGDIINLQHSALEYGSLTKVEDLDAFLEDKKAPLENFHFLNPSTFKKVEGVPNPLNNDKVSTRCNANVKERRYMVFEFDYPEGDEHGPKNAERFTSFAMAMADFAPLVMAVETGGKSIHFWFDAKDLKKSLKQRFFQIGCLHGADPRLGVKSQIARMPNTPAAKEGRGIQSVLYLDLGGANHPEKWDLPGFEKCLKQSKHLDFYYDPTKSKPYITRQEDSPEEWTMINKDSFKVRLGSKGMRINAEKELGEIVSPADSFISEVEFNRCINATLKGAAGYHSGFYELGNQKYIVLTSPNLIKPKKGEFPTITKFLQGLLGHEEAQLHALFGWAKGSVKAAYNDGKRRADVKAPAQFLNLCGEANAGKTLLTEHLLAPILGGGIAKADPLFKKYSSEQNAEMFAAPLLVLDDSDAVETNFEYKRSMAEKIKGLVVGRKEGYRAMHQDRINITPFWRFVRCMNLEPHTISTIPALEAGFEDKIIILHALDMKHGPLGPEMIGDWFKRFEARFKKELPAFIHWLLHEYEQPKEFVDPSGRFPVISYKSPTIVDMMNDGSPEQYLASRIDGDCEEALFGGLFDDGEKHQWTGSVDKLYDTIAGIGARTQQTRFQKVCPNSRILLTQLRALEKKHPERIIYSKRQEELPKKKEGCAYWIIKPKVQAVVELDEEALEML